MMRKILLSQVLSLLFVFSAFAGQIDVNNAKNVAKNFYWEKVTLRKGTTYNNINLSLVSTRSEGNIPVYYVFNVNQDDGFVIIAADDDVYPFLGFAFTGKYMDNIEQPINFIEWMDHSKDQILFVRENGLQADEQISEAWNKYQTKPQPTDPILGVNPLLTTIWDQGIYYNASCPVDNAGPGGHVYAGCVATAMGQVMKYFNYPEQGTGSHSYYCAPYGTQSVNFGATTYNWSSMPNSLYYHNSAVATLLYHCGVSVDMMYSPTGSGAYTSDTRSALINYFSYSSSAQYKQKSSYSTSGWESLLRNELDASRPMIYRGQGTGGHAFVCDGYQGTNYFHFNWGWSGYANGYFYVSNLNPAGANFTTLQAAVIGIQPSNLAPVANFTSDVTNVTAGGEVNFTDQSTGNITSRNWAFDGGTPSSSTQQNPTITYNTAGNYTVSLTVTGPGGSDTETKTNYITVSGGGTSQSLSLNEGYQFVSSYAIPENPDMMEVLSDILNDNLIFVRSSDGGVFRKIGPNWVNGIGDWTTVEGYLFKMESAEELVIEGTMINPQTPIDLSVGYQFVSFLPETSMNAMDAFANILTDKLVFIRNSQAQLLRKIGPNWVNGIGNCDPGEGYLIKMNEADILIYPAD